MFDSVTYSGFEGRDDLKAIAVRGTEFLAKQIVTWREAASIAWRVSGGDLVLRTTLSLPEATVSGEDVVPVRYAAPGEEHMFRLAVRGVWLLTLEALTNELAARREAADLEPAGV